MATTLARFFRRGKRYFPAPAVLFLLRVEQAEQHFLNAAGAGGLELLSDSGLQGCVADFDGHGWLLGFKGTAMGVVNQKIHEGAGPWNPIPRKESEE